MKRIGWIGTGVMGEAMARHLLENGYELWVYTRTKEKAETLLDAGARWCESAGECAKNRDAVFTMVGYPQDVEEVYFGENGVLQHASPGTYLIDCTTTSPKLSVRIDEEARKRGLHALDAPVSGGDTGAKNAALSIMAGGAQEDFDACLELLRCMGTNIVYEGPAGFGQHTKMANQIALAGAISGVCEAICYAEKEGLDVQRMLDSISKGAAGSWQMSNMAPRILKGDFAPGFFVKHYIKDMKIAMEEAKAAGASLEVLQTVLSMYQSLADAGSGDLGTQALIQYYQK